MFLLHAYFCFLFVFVFVHRKCLGWVLFCYSSRWMNNVPKSQTQSVIQFRFSTTQRTWAKTKGLSFVSTKIRKKGVKFHHWIHTKKQCIDRRIEGKGGKRREEKSTHPDVGYECWILVHFHHYWVPLITLSEKRKMKKYVEIEYF